MSLCNDGARTGRRKLLAAAGAALALPFVGSARAQAGGLAQPAGLLRRALPRRRRHRRLRPAAHGGADPLARPPGDHRQPRRRRRHGRRGHRRQGGARRLHLLHGRGPPHDRAVDVPEARLLAGERLHPGRPDRQRAAGRGRQSAAGRRHRPEELPRPCAQESRPAQLRLGRQRHLAPPRRRAVQAAVQDLHHPHPLPRRRAGAAGPDHRPGRRHVRRPRLLVGAHQERPHPRPRHRLAEAGAGLPRPADLRRAGNAELPGRDLVRPLGAQGHAQGDRRADGGGDAEGLRHRRAEDDVDRPRRRDARTSTATPSAASSSPRPSAGRRS